jgi:hypothetical protein
MHDELDVTDLHDVAVSQVLRRREVRVRLVPEHPVVGVQRDFRPGVGAPR